MEKSIRTTYNMSRNKVDAQLLANLLKDGYDTKSKVVDLVAELKKYENDINRFRILNTEGKLGDSIFKLIRLENNAELKEKYQKYYNLLRLFYDEKLETILQLLDDANDKQKLLEIMNRIIKIVDISNENRKSRKYFYKRDYKFIYQPTAKIEGKTDSNDCCKTDGEIEMFPSIIKGVYRFILKNPNFIITRGILSEVGDIIITNFNKLNINLFPQCEEDIKSPLTEEQRTLADEKTKVLERNWELYELLQLCQQFKKQYNKVLSEILIAPKTPGIELQYPKELNKLTEDKQTIISSGKTLEDLGTALRDYMTTDIALAEASKIVTSSQIDDGIYRKKRKKIDDSIDLC